MKSFHFSLGRIDINRLKSNLFYLLLLMLPLGRRKILAQFTGGFDEYEAIFLYLSDIILLLFLFFSFKDIWRFVGSSRRELWLWCLAALGAMALVSVGCAVYHSLAVYDFLRLISVMLLALGVGAGIKSGWLRLNKIFLVLIFLGIFEAVLGFSQFARQESIGLQVLGEPSLPNFAVSAIGTKIPAGIARLDIASGKLIRGYGTFPHPNVLSAFLLLSLAALCYFSLKNVFPWGTWLRHGFTDVSKKDFFNYVWREIFLSVGIFIIALGLLVTFSRTAWLAAILLAFAFSFFGFFTRTYRRKAVKLFFISWAIIFSFVGTFGVFIFPRAQVSLGEPAVTYRLRYDEVGFTIIKNQPLGVGIGNQLIYGVRNNIYRELGMTELWEWQPVHNIYLLMASEIGIIGALAFVVLMLALFIKMIRQNWGAQKTDGLLGFAGGAMLAVLLFFGLADHFLWTLQPGRLMLWLAVGILMGLVAGKINEKHKPS